MDDRFGIPPRESESAEFKASMSELHKAIQSGSAMLNSAGGGSVFIGVRDDGEITGIEQGDRTHDKIAHALTKLSPSFWPIIETTDLPNGKIVLRFSFPGNSGPYRFDGRPYIRVGASNHQLPEEQYQRLILERYHSTDRWELKQSIFDLSDLDLRRLRDTVETAITVGRLNEPASREPMVLLQGLGLLTDGKINNAAAVTFGSEQSLAQLYPQCQVRLARFDGVSKSQFRDNRRYSGNIFDLLRLSAAFVSEYNPIESQISPDQIQRTDHPSYQPEAVREALVNAFVHRDYAVPGSGVDVAIYDDRLEITSTGGLRFGLTVNDLLSVHQSRPWNPIIAHVLQRQGSFESWGRGTIRMFELARIAGLPDPVLVDEQHAFTVRMLNPVDAVGAVDVMIPSIDYRVEAALSEYGSLTLSDLVNILAWTGTRRQLQLELQKLKESGNIEVSGQRRWARWRLRHNN